MEKISPGKKGVDTSHEESIHAIHEYVRQPSIIKKGNMMTFRKIKDTVEYEEKDRTVQSVRTYAQALMGR